MSYLAESTLSNQLLENDLLGSDFRPCLTAESQKNDVKKKTNFTKERKTLKSSKRRKKREKVDKKERKKGPLSPLEPSAKARPVL